MKKLHRKLSSAQLKVLQQVRNGRKVHRRWCTYYLGGRALNYKTIESLIALGYLIEVKQPGSRSVTDIFVSSSEFAVQ